MVILSNITHLKENNLQSNYAMKRNVAIENNNNNKNK